MKNSDLINLIQSFNRNEGDFLSVFNSIVDSFKYQHIHNEYIPSSTIMTFIKTIELLHSYRYSHHLREFDMIKELRKSIKDE